MACAKAWGILPTQWLELSRDDRALITAHELNEQRCPGCGTTLGLDASEIEGIEAAEYDCAVCKAKHRIIQRDKRKRPEWLHRFVGARLRRNQN